MPTGQVLAERLRVIRLFDAYGGMLTSRQRALLERYYLRDFSLGEIADQLEITRQAVFDGLRRAVDALERLERTVHAMERRQAVADQAAALERRIRGLGGRIGRPAVTRLLANVAALKRAVE